MLLFNDRMDAGRRLAAAFKPAGRGSAVLGIPRGGVAVGFPVAEKLGCPLEPITLRKLPLPRNDQMGFGVVTLDRNVILNPGIVEAGYVGPEEIAQIADEVYREVLRRDRLYRDGRPFPELAGRRVIIVDDGLATGYTMLGAIAFARGKGAGEVTVAVPVAHAEAYRLVEEKADRIVCLHRDEHLSFAVASFYREFPDMTDDEVAALLERSRAKTGATP